MTAKKEKKVGKLIEYEKGVYTKGSEFRNRGEQKEHGWPFLYRDLFSNWQYLLLQFNLFPNQKNKLMTANILIQ